MTQEVKVMGPRFRSVYAALAFEWHPKGWCAVARMHRARARGSGGDADASGI